MYVIKNESNAIVADGKGRQSFKSLAVVFRPDGGQTNNAKVDETLFDEDGQTLVIREVVQQAKPDDKFYWVSGPHIDGTWTSTERSPEDVKQVDDDGNAILDADGNQVIALGLKSQWLAKTKETANSLLAHTDWQVIAKAERDRAIDSNVATYRAAVVAKCAAIEKSITDIADTAVPSGYGAAKIKGESERTNAEKKIISDYEAEVAPKFAAFKALFDAPTKTTTKTMTNGDGSTYEETTVEITGNPPIHDWPVMGE